MNTSIEMPGSVVKCRALRLKWQAAILVSYLALFRSHICSFSRSPTAMHTNTDTQHALWDTVAVLAKHIPISILGLCARVSLCEMSLLDIVSLCLEGTNGRRTTSSCFVSLSGSDQMRGHSHESQAHSNSKKRDRERGRGRGGREGGREGVKKIVWEWINTFNSSSLLRLQKSRQAQRKREGDWDTA